MSRPLPQPSPHSRPLPFPLSTNHYVPLQYTQRPPSPTKRALPLSPSGSTAPLVPPSPISRRPLPVPSPRYPQPQAPAEPDSDPEQDPLTTELLPSPQHGIRDLPTRAASAQAWNTDSFPRRFHAPAPAKTLPSQPIAPDPRQWSANVNPLPPPPSSPARHAPNGISSAPAFSPLPPRKISAPMPPAPDLDDAPPPGHPSLLRNPPPRAGPTSGTEKFPSRRNPPPRWTPNPSPNVQPQHIASPSPLDSRFGRADIPTIELRAENGPGSGRNSNGSSTHSTRTAPPSSPAISVTSPPDDSDESDNEFSGPSIRVDSPPSISVSISGPSISISSPDSGTKPTEEAASLPPPPIPMRRAGGLICGNCRGAIIGRVVNAMGVRWHPGCFRCTVCQTLLEHVSSYERDGRPYCHLDYHERFAPRCYTCKTAIIEERFITLDDPALGGKRTYHEQHFFCAECGDPFLSPSSDRDESGADDVGFTVYHGHPYCEACHIRLRMPKCRKCKKSIRDGMQAVEALGGKWCWGCFVCEGCERPFEEPSFFQREGLPFCERCFSIILKNEL